MGGPPLQSLVKYDTPSLLTTKDKSKKGGKGGKKLPPVETKQPLTQTEDILNSILPPRYAPATSQRRRYCAATAHFPVRLELVPVAAVRTAAAFALVLHPFRSQSHVCFPSRPVAVSGLRMGSSGCSTCPARPRRVWM